MKNSADNSQKLQCVVSVGFAGARRLVDAGELESNFYGRIQRYLSEQVTKLPAELQLTPQHFLCGLSQVAVGADTLFTRVCKEFRIPQWIMLPQDRRDYLNAVGSNNEPDFSSAERQEAEKLIQSEHIIHEQVVSHASDRRERFEEVNLKIACNSDVVVCVLPVESEGKPGGTVHLLELAKRRKLPTLEIRVAKEDGQPVCTSTWHKPPNYKPPQLPWELKFAPESIATDKSNIPNVKEYARALKTFASGEAKWRQRLFRYAAVIIILTHLLATVAATTVLATHGPHQGSDAAAGPSPWEWVLGGELVLLACGFGVHQYLHYSHATSTWALARLVAEIARSLRAIGDLHFVLEHLFNLPLPGRLQPLLRTLNILHLRSTRSSQAADWIPLRQAYIANRLDDEKNGQIPFYKRSVAHDIRRLKNGTKMFFACSLLAMVATAGKLAILTRGDIAEAMSWASEVLGVLAVVLPVLAIGALSYCAAMDYVARVHTFGETLEFLLEQRPLLESTSSSVELSNLILETESRLLGETANWYSRRAFIDVT